MVCVIGGDVQEQFFRGVDPLGKRPEDPQRAHSRLSALRRCGVPHSDNPSTITCTSRSARGESSSAETATFNSMAMPPTQIRCKEIIEDARTVMRNRHKLKGKEDDDFGVVNTDALNNQIDRFTGAIAMVVVPVTFMSLVVGGIVVMNIMLVSVTERTFEIGLRKAIGATKTQILTQFLIESSFLTAVGGVFGLLLAAVVCWIVRIATPIPMTITPGYVLLR